MHEAAAEINRRYLELHDDRRRIETYGAERPNVFAGVRVDGDPARLLAGFTGDLGAHAARLRELVAHADRLDVVETPASQAQLGRIRSAIQKELGVGPNKPLRGLSGPGGGAFRVHVDLAAYAKDDAQRLLKRYGDAVEVRVGAFQYPLGLDVRPTPPIASQEPLLNESEVEVLGVQPLAVRSGYDLHSELLVTNRGSAPLVIENSGTQFARVVNPTTGQVVGGFAGHHILPLARFAASPGATVTVPLTWARRPT